MKLLFSSVVMACIAHTAVLAGDLSDPVIEAPIAPVAEPALDWSGFYLGGLASAASGTYGDSMSEFADFAGSGSWQGKGYGIVAGYNFQRNSIVYGAEITYSEASVAGVAFCSNPAFGCRGKIDSIATVRGRMGYLLNDQSMVFTSLGLAKADIYYSTERIFDGTEAGETLSNNGVMVGLGYEQAFTPEITVRASVNRYEFASEVYEMDVPYAGIQSTLTELEIGLLFKF